MNTLRYLFAVVSAANCRIHAICFSSAEAVFIKEILDKYLTEVEIVAIEGNIAWGDAPLKDGGCIKYYSIFSTKAKRYYGIVSGYDGNAEDITEENLWQLFKTQFLKS